jgi:hypothetical protein
VRLTSGGLVVILSVAGSAAVGLLGHTLYLPLDSSLLSAWEPPSPDTQEPTLVVGSHDLEVILRRVGALFLAIPIGLVGLGGGIYVGRLVLSLFINDLSWTVKSRACKYNFHNPEHYC